MDISFHLDPQIIDGFDTRVGSEDLELPQLIVASLSSA